MYSVLISLLFIADKKSQGGPGTFKELFYIFLCTLLNCKYEFSTKFQGITVFLDPMNALQNIPGVGGGGPGVIGIGPRPPGAQMQMQMGQHAMQGGQQAGKFFRCRLIRETLV